MRFVALWYVLASAAVLVRVVAHRTLQGDWGLYAPGLLQLAVATAGQALALVAARRLLRGRRRDEDAVREGRPSPGAGGLASFLGRWSLLVVVLGVLGAAFSGVVLNRLDLRFLALLELLVIPTVQAVVVPWVEARWGLVGLARTLGEGAGDRLVAALLAAAALVVAVSWLPSAVAVPAGLRLWWAGAAAVVAGVVLIRAGRGRPDGRPGRPVLVLLGAWLLALGLDPFVSWISRVPGVLPEGWPTVLRWAAVGGTLAVATFALLAAGSAAVRDERAPAADYLDLAGGAAFVVALIAVLSTFLRRYPTPGWSGALATGLAVAATLVLAGSVLVLRGGSDTG